MGTDITAQVPDLPTVTPQHAKSLSPQALKDHRARIAFDIKTVLSAYFQPHEAEEVKAAQLAWWCDELQDWTQDQVLWALRKWNRDFPRLRPTPGDILRICKAARGRKHAATIKPHPQPVQSEPRISKDEAARILAEAGFAPRKMQETGDNS